VPGRTCRGVSPCLKPTRRVPGEQGVVAWIPRYRLGVSCRMPRFRQVKQAVVFKTKKWANKPPLPAKEKSLSPSSSPPPLPLLPHPRLLFRLPFSINYFASPSPLATSPPLHHALLHSAHRPALLCSTALVCSAFGLSHSTTKYLQFRLHSL
jgi:hypothetical protein